MSNADQWVVEVRDQGQNRWRVVVNTADKGEARFGLFEYVMRHPGRAVRITPPAEGVDSEDS